MVIDNLNIMGVTIDPFEDHTPLVVNAD